MKAYPAPWFMGIGLAVLAAVAAISVHFAWTSAFAAIDAGPDPRSRRPEPAMRLATLRAGPDSAFQPELLITKPLFSPSRTAPVPRPAAPAPVQPVVRKEEGPPPTYIVGGVILSSTTRKVLLRNKQRDPGLWLNQGEATKEGWAIVAIDSHTIVLGRGERRITLPLSSGRSAQTTVTASKAARPAQAVE
jgi:hypothetical protein